MSVAVVVPYRAQPGREEAFTFVTRRLQDDGWPLLIADAKTEGWCKADAVGWAITVPMAPEDVMVVHDADVFVSPRSLRAAVAHVEEHGGWAIPHHNVERLSESSTLELLRTGNVPADVTYTRWPYLGMAGGGVVVLHRATYDDCPLDKRFIGWGDEDQSWGWALSCLYGLPMRTDGVLRHLWHPHPAPGARHSASLDAHRIWRAYRAYRDDPIRMRLLLNGAR
jgi:hypothetical protein